MGLTVTGNGANDRRVMHGLVVDDGAVKAGASFTPVGGQVVSRFAKLES
jgi:hypothetical protein